MDTILSEISKKQNIVRNKVGIDKILNINADSFFPRNTDFLNSSTNFEKYDNYIDKLLQIFVNCYAIKTTNISKYDDKIKVIHKNDINQNQNQNEDYFPYFIKTCGTSQKKICHKKIEDAKKKFI